MVRVNKVLPIINRIIFERTMRKIDAIVERARFSKRSNAQQSEGEAKLYDLYAGRRRNGELIENNEAI